MTEIEKPQLDSKDQSPGMPRWLIGTMLGIAIYLTVAFVLVQFFKPLFDASIFSPMSHCDGLRKGTQFNILTNLLFIRLIIRFFFNPVIFFFGGTLKIPNDTFLYYFTGISIFAVGGAVFSSIQVTKTWRLIIGIVIILAWISVTYITAFVFIIFTQIACYG